MNARFTSIAVRLSSKAKTYTVVYPEVRNGRVIGIQPGLGTEFRLSASMLAITVNRQTSDARKIADQGGDLYWIAVKDVTRQTKQTVLDLFIRNPWNNEQSSLFVKALNG